MGLKRLAVMAALLTAWYTYSGDSARYNPDIINRIQPTANTEEKGLEQRLKDKGYTLTNGKDGGIELRVPSQENAPSSIKNEPTSEKPFHPNDKYSLPEIIETLKGPIRTDKIDFENDFEIKTERYTLARNNDFLVSRGIGYILSTPTKLFFWDSNASYGLDGEHTKRILALLENDKSLKNLTVRVNNTRAWYDFYRMFTDKKVTDRNNIIARFALGVPSLILSELWSEFGRGDYYNPLTQTAVLYSNIDSVSLHELGHHRDHQRFSCDWIYSLSRTLPPVMLYQEWKASDYAYNDLKNPDKYQFYRYLMPAFATYVLAAYAMTKKMLIGKREQ